MEDSLVISSVILVSTMFCYTYLLASKMNNLESLLMASMMLNSSDIDSDSDSDSSESLSEEPHDNREDSREEMPVDSFIYQLSNVAHEIAKLKNCALDLNTGDYEKYSVDKLFIELNRLCDKDNESGFHQILNKYRLDGQEEQV